MIEDRHCVFFPGDKHHQLSIEKHHRKVMEGGEQFREVILKEILSDDQVQSLRDAVGPLSGSCICLQRSLSDKAPPLLIKKPIVKSMSKRPISVLQSGGGSPKPCRKELIKQIGQMPPARKRLSDPVLRNIGRGSQSTVTFRGL